MPPGNPPSHFWTLCFKLNRVSFLLYIDPLQPLPIVRADLLAALLERKPNGIGSFLPDGEPVHYPLPLDSDDIVLAKPKDINDLSAGWETIGDVLDNLLFEDEMRAATAATVTAKGKGKANAAGSGNGKGAIKNANDCPKGAGLRDGGVVAFRFRSEEEKARRQKLADGTLDVDEIAKDGLLGQEPAWDVIVPTEDDTYEEVDADDAEAEAAAREAALAMR